MLKLAFISVSALAFLTIASVACDTPGSQSPTARGLPAADAAAGETVTDTPSQDTATADTAQDAAAEKDTLGPEALTCNEPLLTIDPLGTLAPAEPVGCTLASDPTGTTFLVDLLDITTPDNAALVGAINPLFQKDMKNGELVILFRITAYDAVTGDATVEAGTGSSCGTYAFDGLPSELTINIQGCDFTTTTTAPLALAPSTVNKPIIVSSLDVTGSFAADQSRILSATLAGTLKESDATGLLVALDGLGEVDMAEFLFAVGVQLDADTNADGTPDAWTLGGNLAARAITNVSL